MTQRTQPIRVLHVIDSLAPGGAERMLVELANGLHSLGVLPSVCVTRDNLSLAKKLHKEITVCQLNRKWKGDIRTLKFYRQLLEDEQIQLIHAHGYTSFMFVFFSRFFIRKSLPIILHAHSSLPPKSFVRLFGQFGIDYFIGPSSDTVSWACRYLRLPETKIALLSNAIDPMSFEIANSVDLSSYFKDRPEFVGAITANVLPAKNFELLFDALTLSHYRDRIGVLIIGSTADSEYFEKCKNRLRYLELKDRVVFLGRREDVPEILVACDFGLFCSSRETGPVAVLEYMAAGLPFVSTKVGEVNHQAALAGLPGIVSANDSAAFALAIDQLLCLPKEEKYQRVHRGRQLLKSHFDIQGRVNKLKNIYQELIDSKYSQ